MRACTAVVTEISYNYGDQMYRAEIEFISKEDWEKELQLLFEDLLDDNGTVSRDCVIEKSDAGVAYAKIKAVYPKKTKEDFGKCSIEDMLNDVSHVLGETRIINEGDSLFFYKKLQKFVDSKEKTTETKEKHNTLPKEMEFWVSWRNPELSDSRLTIVLASHQGRQDLCQVPSVSNGSGHS